MKVVGVLSRINQLYPNKQVLADGGWRPRPRTTEEPGGSERETNRNLPGGHELRCGSFGECYNSDMSTLAEIELAARRLGPAEKQQLLILIAQSLRQGGHPLPEPRVFSVDEMQSWMDEDERDLKAFRGQR